MKRVLVILPALLLVHAAVAQGPNALDRAQMSSPFTQPMDRDWNSRHGWRQLRGEADRLNNMAAAVRSQMRRYGAGRFQWNRLSQIQSDIARINYKVQNRAGDRDRVYRDIRNARARLHQIEIDLRFRERDYFRWR